VSKRAVSRKLVDAAVALPARQSTGETSTVESDAVPSGAFLMRKWIGERDYRLMKSGPSATTFQVSRNLSLARGQ
jgi:nuclear transport factor 2 (NTF2) superfamily protein